MYPFEVLKQTCRGHGLGQSHFGWSENSQTFIRSNLRIVVLTIPILLFLVNLLQIQPTEEFRSSLGRAIMGILLLVIFSFVLRVFHPQSRLYGDVSEDNQNDYWYRFSNRAFHWCHLRICWSADFYAMRVLLHDVFNLAVDYCKLRRY